MLKNLSTRNRTIALILIAIPLLLFFLYSLFRSGPLAAIPVTVAKVENKAISPALFGIGTVEARHTFKIGPISAGRLLKLDVDVGDHVKAGQVLGEMDPVDLDDKIQAQAAALKQSEAQRTDATTRRNYAKTQAKRYEQLLAVRSTSEENYLTKQNEYLLSEAGLNAAEQQLARIRSDYEGLLSQRKNIKLIAPTDAIVTARKADPGTTLVAGQAALELTDPKTIWINTRFDQINSKGLKSGLPAKIVLRSDKNNVIDGRIYRVDLLADSITEELTAKIVFDPGLEKIPPLGELTEVTVGLPETTATKTINNASIRHQDSKIGVWQVQDGKLTFTPVKLGAVDLNGTIQILDGLDDQAQVVLYSQQALTKNSRITIVDRIPGSGK